MPDNFRHLSKPARLNLLLKNHARAHKSSNGCAPDDPGVH
jgi:hypothetical protein